jgi:hypothetical protein
MKKKKVMMIKIMMMINLEIYSAAEQPLVLKRDFAALVN